MLARIEFRCVYDYGRQGAGFTVSNFTDAYTRAEFVPTLAEFVPARVEVRCVSDYGLYMPTLLEGARGFKV